MLSDRSLIILCHLCNLWFTRVIGEIRARLPCLPTGRRPAGNPWLRSIILGSKRFGRDDSTDFMRSFENNSKTILREGERVLIYTDQSVCIMAENKPKEIRVQQILNAAMQVFVKKGYADTHMTDIMERTGLSKGAIYHHYSSKRELFLDLIDHWHNYSIPDFHKFDESNMPAADILKGFAQEVVKTFKQNPAIFLAELEFWSMANRDEEVREKVRRLYGEILSLFEKVIKKGIETGEFKNLDPKISALSIMTALQGIIWFSLFESQSFKGEAYLRHVMDFIIYGFSKN